MLSESREETDHDTLMRKRVKNLKILLTMVAVFALACGDDSNSGAGAVPVGQGGQTGQGGQAGGNQTLTEACDGQDNDNDGSVDEGLTNRPCSTACGPGEEVCSQGAWRDCSAPPVFAEACDGQDNDCDNKVDEQLTRMCETDCGTGQEMCMGGDWAGCTAPKPAIEACDGQDNDCDGVADEDVFRACDVECGTGTQECLGAMMWSECEAQGAAEEICNNNDDDDCDGIADEGCSCTAGETQACSVEIGECEAGVRFCQDDGTFGDCVNEQTMEPVLEQGVRAEYDANCLPDCRAACMTAEDPNACDAACTETCAEPCNQRDDDCDGRVDEMLTGVACSVDEGECSVGQLRCGETGPECFMGVLPRDEACDLLDNDCDGAVDETAVELPETCDGLDNDCDGNVDEGVVETNDAGNTCVDATATDTLEQDDDELDSLPEPIRGQLQPATDADWYAFQIKESAGITTSNFTYTVEILDLQPNAGYELCVRSKTEGGIEIGNVGLFRSGLESMCTEDDNVDLQCVTQSGSDTSLSISKFVDDRFAGNDDQLVAVKVTATNANACSPFRLNYYVVSE